MARSKKPAAQNGGSSSISTSTEDLSSSDVKQLLTPSSPDRPTGPLSVVISPEDREVVKVNNASLTELKNACDDAVKRVSLSLQPPQSRKLIMPHEVPIKTRLVQADPSAYRYPVRPGVA